MDWERIYRRLPIPLQHLACALEGYRVRRVRYGGTYDSLTRTVEERGRWPEFEITRFRDARLQAFIRYCYEHVPYYQELFRRRSVDFRDIRTLEDMQQIPILTKDDIKDNYQKLLSDAVPAERRIIHHTSGTTGGGLRFATTREAMQEQWAVWWRYRHRHGLTDKTWCGYFGGRSIVPIEQECPPFYRVNFAGRQILLSSYHMSERNLGNYVDAIRKWQPPWIHGYPSSIALFAAYLVEHGGDLGYQVRWVSTGAENLLETHRSVIQRAFGVFPIQHYGMAEAVANISECEKGALHVDEDFAAVEFEPIGPNGLCRILGSNFTNPAAPMLRYEIQDNVICSNRQCNCGHPGRIVESIDGRSEDYVVLNNGARIGRLDHVFKDLVRIREAQVYQPAAGKIVLRVVRAGNYQESDELSLLNEMRTRVGSDTDIRVDYVENIERTAAGKLRFVVSDVT